MVEHSPRILASEKKITKKKKNPHTHKKNTKRLTSLCPYYFSGYNVHATYTWMSIYLSISLSPYLSIYLNRKKTIVVITKRFKLSVFSSVLT